jgi:molybdopterin-guanine dinucleotide biosynthesis protein A
MGAEKALLPVGGEALILVHLRQLAASFDSLAVSVAQTGPSSGLARVLADASAALGRPVAVVRDDSSGQGPLSGIVAALKAAASERTFFMAVDVRSINTLVIRALWALAQEPQAQGAVPRWRQGLEPAYAVYGRALLPLAEELLVSQDRSLQALARAPEVRRLDLEQAAIRRQVFGASEPDLAELFGPLNTVEDLADWRRRTGRS